MSRGWALIEFRPGRYAKISPGGEFLGMATEAEVRAWFATREAAQKPAAKKPPHPLPGPQPLPKVEQSLLGEPSTPQGKPLTESREPKQGPAPTAAAQSQQPPSSTPPRTEPKPLPPFLEHLRVVPEPIRPEPAPAQEPKPLPPFLARKRGETGPAEAPTKPEPFDGSLIIPAKVPTGSTESEPVEKTPTVSLARAEPDSEEPNPQGPALAPLSRQLDLFGPDESPKESEPIEVQSRAALLHLELDEDWPTDEDEETEEAEELYIAFSQPTTKEGRSRPASVLIPSITDTPVNHDSIGRWLWLDPRQEVNHNPPAFDLAAFLQRAIALFQTKEWTGGQKPGRLAVHPDQMLESLRSLADSLGLEVECDPLVNPGTYRLALPKERTR